MRGLIYILVILFCNFMPLTVAQKLNFDWAKSFGGDSYELPRFMKVDGQGNTYLFGETNSTDFKIEGKYVFSNFIPNLQKAFLVKYSKNGELLWSKILLNDVGINIFGLDIDIEQNIILTGIYYGSFLDIDTIKLGRTDIFNSNVFITKLSSTGNIINHKIYSTLSSITTYGGITHDSKNHFYVSGCVDGNIYDQNNDTLYKRDRKDGKILFIIKMDSQLNIQWIKSFGGKGDQIFDVICDQEDNLIVYGWYRYSVLTIDSLMVNNYTKEYTPVVGYGDEELFITKLDSNGKAIWLKTISGSRAEYPSYDDIAIDTDDNIYLGGLFQSDTLFFNKNVNLIRTKNKIDQFDLFYAKLDKNGECKWAKKIINGHVNIDDMSIHLLKNGKLIITGNYDSSAFRTGPVILPNNGQNDCFILLANTEGDILSGTSFGGEDIEWDQQITSYDTSIYIFGAFSSKKLQIGDEVLLNDTTDGTTDAIFIKLHIDSLTSINDFKPVSENIIVYPNPVNDFLHISTPEYFNIQSFGIHDITGKYYSVELINKEFNLSILPAGMYFLSVELSDHRKVTKRIIKY